MPKITVKRPKSKASPLDLKDRQELARMLNTDVFQRAFGNAMTCKPGVFIAAAGTDIKDAAAATLACSNRLHEIRGWELFQTAIFAQAEDPKPKRTEVPEQYQEE